MGRSLTKNSIFYLFYEVLNVVFPFLTGMYVARVLLPESIGQVAYAQNIAQYFVILSFLGIPTYGMREIAKTRDDKVKLNKLYTELIIINAISTVVFSLIYLIVIFSVRNFRDNIILFLIVGISISLNILNNSWLYTGLEEFPYISIRNASIKLIAFILLIIFVRDSTDYLLYAIITVLGLGGNYILNIFHARKFVKLDFSGLCFKRHLKPIFFLVVVNLAIEIYTLVDTTMLGAMCEKNNVAFYSYGSKINKIFLQVVNTFTMVLVPRISSYYKQKRYDEYNRLLTKVLKIIIILSVPMIVGIYFTSDTVMTIIYGQVYINSAQVLKILSLILIISPIGYLLGSRVLLVSGNESKMVICVSAGAITNVVCNYVLIPTFKEYGASIASVIGELIVMFTYLYFGKKFYKLSTYFQTVIKVIFSVVIMSVYLFIIKNVISSTLFALIVQIVGGILIYIIMLYLLNEEIVREFSLKTIHRIRKREC